MFCFDRDRVSDWLVNVIYSWYTGCSKHNGHVKGYDVFFYYSGTCLELFYVFSTLSDYVFYV